MNRTKKYLSIALLLSQLLGLPVWAQTQPADHVNPLVLQPVTTLSPLEALNRAWQGNASLRQLRREYARAQARLLQTGLLPNPELGWVAEDFAGSAAFTDDRFTQFTLEWIQTIPLSDRLARQRRIAELELQLLEWEYRLQLLRLAREVSLGYSRLRYLTARLELVRELLSNARETQAQMQTRVDAGKQPPVAALQARQQTLALEAESIDLGSQQRVAAIALSALWGTTPVETISVMGALTSPQPLSAVETYQNSLNNHPQVARWQLEGTYRQESLQAAQARVSPDLTAGGGLRYHPPGDWGVVASITLPLPLYDQNKGAIEEARLRQGSLGAEREQDLRQLNAELHQAYETHRGAYARWQLYHQQLQLAQEEFRIAVIVFDAGKTGYLEVLQSQQSYFNSRRNQIEAHWELEQSLIGIRTITQDFEPGFSPATAIPITTPDTEAGGRP